MQNLSTEAIEKYKKAGQIAKAAIAYGKTQIKENQLVLTAVQNIEHFINSAGGKLAFPVNISANAEAAHYTPANNDTRIFKRGDIIKLDLGVHIDGYIADTAVTVEVGTNEHAFLIDAAKKALEEVINTIHIGIKLTEIGAIIEDTIRFYGFKSIRNLSGHELKKYTLHAGKIVPNYDNGDSTRLEPGMAFAIEPFATTGLGLIREHGYGNIAILTNPPKNTEHRYYYDLIFQNYNKLPFAERWLYDMLPNVTSIISTLVKNRALYKFPILQEKKKGMVSQAEHTMLIVPEGVIVTTI